MSKAALREWADGFLSDRLLDLLRRCYRARGVGRVGGFWLGHFSLSGVGLSSGGARKIPEEDGGEFDGWLDGEDRAAIGPSRTRQGSHPPRPVLVRDERG